MLSNPPPPLQLQKSPSSGLRQLCRCDCHDKTATNRGVQQGTRWWFIFQRQSSEKLILHQILISSITFLNIKGSTFLIKDAVKGRETRPRNTLPRIRPPSSNKNTHFYKQTGIWGWAPQLYIQVTRLRPPPIHLSGN